MEKIHIDTNYGIYLEKVGDFRDSIFNNVYYDAFQMTEQLIGNVKYDKYSQKTIRNMNLDDMHSDKKTYNIIPFIGDRGTGKTSAMYSFSYFLRNFNEQEYKKFLGKYGTEKQVYEKDNFIFKEDSAFICIDMIDASLLDNDEDIFEAVLAKMLQLLLKEKKSSRCTNWNDDRENPLYYKHDQLINRFQEIYNNLNLNIEKEIGFESPVELLRNLAKSLDIYELFKDLVPMYLETINPFNNNNYLVICIDDLDLNCKNGFRMLEQIHRYLMVPNVIIYMTFSISGISTICEKHFKDYGFNKTKKLAQDYLDKVLPISQRIYMPILVEKSKKTQLDDEDNVKKSFLKKILNKTGVLLDPLGVKKHFYEPETIRELVHLYIFFDKMQNLSLSNKDDDYMKDQFLVSFDRNIIKILEDIYYRMSENLNQIQQDLFKDLYLMDTARQVIKFCAYKENLDNSSKKGENNFTDDVDNMKYTYGEFLQGIYRLGREHNDQKLLIHCILAMQSAQLTQLYIHAVYDRNNKNDYKTRLIQSFQRSVTGNWGNNLLPLLRKDSKLTYNWGYMEVPFSKESLFKVKIVSNTDKSVTNFCHGLLDDKELSFVKSIELFYFYFVNFDESWGNIKIEKLTPPSKSKSESVNNVVETSEYSASIIVNECNIIFDGLSNFDITGFILNSMNYEEFFDKVHKVILGALLDFMEFSKKEEADILLKKIKETSLYEEYKNWDMLYGFAPLPVFSSDVFYNLIKRITRRRESSIVIDIEDVLKENVKLLDLIKETLEAIDKYYYGEVYNNQFNFSKIFLNCPFVNYILNCKYTFLFSNLFGTYIKLAVTKKQFMSTERIADIESSLEG